MIQDQMREEVRVTHLDGRKRLYAVLKIIESVGLEGASRVGCRNPHVVAPNCASLANVGKYCDNLSSFATNHRILSWISDIKLVAMELIFFPVSPAIFLREEISCCA
nr:hypothetical protein Iba_chr13bCG8680 [Ipomoea batatas]